MAAPELLVTLWPSFPHFARFGTDPRLSGIRLNSAMMSQPELDHELMVARDARPSVPLWFDVKGRQPRVIEVHPDPDRLIVTLNHAIQVATPQPVLFKAGEDEAVLERLEDGGRRLVFAPGQGPTYTVRAGESLHVRHPSFRILGPLFTDEELGKIAKVKAAGVKRWFLSYVELPKDLSEFLELVGRDAEVMLKIESERGLLYVERSFRKRDNLTLVAARGDLYVEIAQPRRILDALRLIRSKDPEAVVASRLLLSVMQPLLADVLRGLAFLQQRSDDETRKKIAAVLRQSRPPSCADFCELAWLVDIGYRRFMLCDELCLDGELLACAVDVFDTFRKDYRPAVSSFLSRFLTP